jgi:Fur family ferric uptake transcriptional regulator
MAIRTNTDIIKEVTNIFSVYLEKSGSRKTPERFAILEEIYLRTDHFDAEALYIHMKTRNYTSLARISLNMRNPTVTNSTIMSSAPTAAR